MYIGVNGIGMNGGKYIEKGPALLQALLGLEGNIAGITFLRDEQDYKRAPEQEFKTSLSYCSMVRLAVKGLSRKGTAVHVSCPGARRALGLDPVNEEYLSGRRYLSLGLYSDLDQAARAAAAVSRMESSVYGFSVQPLQMCTNPPHVVLIFCNPYQAMRLVQGAAYAHPDLGNTACFGNQGVCAELTARPHVTGKPNVSMLCSNTRYSCAWGDGVVGFGIPFSMFQEVVDGVLATMDAAEPDHRKQEIAARAKAAGLDVTPCPGKAYFMGLTKPSKTKTISKEAGAS